ncbi:MAG TPA: hypothetical protein VGF16_14225 [Bryobacteraceae bacterium]
MTGTWNAVGLTIFTASALVQPAAPPAFEVAYIKAVPGERRGAGNRS